MREISICYTTATYEVHTFKRSFIKRQTIGTSSDNELQTSGTKSSNEWQRVTMNDNEWQRVGAFVQWMKTAYIVHFKEWMIAIISMTKRDTLLLQRMDRCN